MTEPGWYEDPYGQAPYRWWDGDAWTGWVSAEVGGVAAPPHGLPESAPSAPSAPLMAESLPPASLRPALGGLVTATVVLVSVAYLMRFLTGSLAVSIVVSEAGLWSTLYLTARTISRRYGTGQVWQDFGFRFRRTDVGRGFVLSWAARLGGTILLIPILANPRLVGTNTRIFQVARDDVSTYLVLAVVATIGAPIFEELFFRGVVLGAMRSRLQPGVAVLAQAVLFGLVHINPFDGLRNVSVFVMTATVGVVFGLAAVRYRRLGPGVAAHAWFNSFTVVVLAFLR